MNAWCLRQNPDPRRSVKQLASAHRHSIAVDAGPEVPRGVSRPGVNDAGFFVRRGGIVVQWPRHRIGQKARSVRVTQCTQFPWQFGFGELCP